MHVTEALAAAYDPPALPTPPQTVPRGTVCAMTGAAITEGYLLRSILADATADIASTFPYRSQSQFVSETTARVFKTRFSGNLLAYEDATGWRGARPMVSRESALLAARPCWSELVRALAPGTRTVAIFSEDVQRRLWPNAAVSPSGPAWRVYLHFGGVSRCLTIRHADLLACLACIEDWYAQDISKDALRAGLLTLAGGPALKKHGWRVIQAAERQIAPWRRNPAFPVALYIAQKPAVALAAAPATKEAPALWHSQAA